MYVNNDMNTPKIKIEVLISNFPMYSEEMGIKLTEPEGRFKWFLASILFGARISEKIAMNTYKTFERYGILSPDKILDAGWDELVRILDEGGYVRYDFSTATKLLEIMKRLKEEYGSVDDIYARASDTEDLERRLKEFKGIGEVTAQVFLRELRGVWRIRKGVSEKAKEAARRLDIKLEDLGEGEELSRIETALVKLNIRYCKKRKCEVCPVSDFCKDKVIGS